MSPLRVLYLLAGLVAAAAFLLGAVCDWGLLSTAFATLDTGDVLLVALGPVLAVLMGAAGVLIAVDVRADIAAARAWHEVHAETVVFTTPAETAPTDRFDSLYVAGPQDECLRRILLAHRVAVPLPPATGFQSLASEPAATQPRATCIEPDVQTVGTVAATNGLGERLTAPAAAERNLGPHLISSSANSARRRTPDYAARKASAPKRLASAGSRWDRSVFASAINPRASGSGFGYDDVVLANRNGRRLDRLHRDMATEPAAIAQPACRGPPAGANKSRGRNERRAAPAPSPAVESSREIGRPQATVPADLVVTDNLGDRIPVRESELLALESYLTDVLDDVLGSAVAETKPT